MPAKYESNLEYELFLTEFSEHNLLCKKSYFLHNLIIKIYFKNNLIIKFKMLFFYKLL